MRIDRARDAARRAIETGVPELVRSLALVEALLARGPERVGSVGDLATCVEHARAIRERGAPSYEGPRRESRESWPTAEDLARDDAEARFLSDVAARIELCLCVLGTFVSIEARDRRVSDELADAAAIERARHLAHREDERAHLVRRLELEAASARRALLTPGGERARPYLEAVEARLARVRALDPETLCTDRRALD